MELFTKTIPRLFLFFLTLNHLCAINNYNPYPFVTWDVWRITGRKFDYIVVGGGAAGISLAVTLSRTFSVLLLERGTSPFGNPDIELGFATGKPFVYADNYTSIAQIFFSEDGFSNVRARVLGGGTAINGGFYNRASRRMLTIDMGLDEVLVNQSYGWVESKIVYKQTLLKPWSIVFRDALIYAGVVPDNGFSFYPLEGTEHCGSIIDDLGRRHVATELLDYANGNNLLVLLNSTVGRVLFEFRGKGVKQRSSGVEFEDRNRVKYRASLKGDGLSEVILCAGALGSPQLLMLSGIGPADHLNSLGIPVVVDSPAVGQGMVDNPATQLRLNSSKPLFYTNVQVVGVTKGSKNYVESGSVYSKTLRAHTCFLSQKVSFPNSKGELHLKTMDPRDNPTVRFNYYADPADLQGCVDGARLQGHVFGSPGMRNFGYLDHATGNVELKFIGKPLPQDIDDRSAMEEYCRSSLVTFYHYHGGCLPDSVINNRNQVYGVDGLRVVDGSTFKASPGANPQATVMMLGRYKAIKFIEERDSPWQLQH